MSHNNVETAVDGHISALFCGVVLMSGTVDFDVERSTLEISVCLNVHIIKGNLFYLLVQDCANVWRGLRS